MTLTTTLQIGDGEPWRLSPQNLPATDVDVWCLLAHPGEALPVGMAELLDGEERARAARFVVEEHRLRFILAHSVTRAVLAAYFGAEPAMLVFETEPGGKPRLRDGALAFNLSHSHDAIVLAVTERFTVGVDVEWMRRLDDRDGLVRRFFSIREQGDFAALPEAERDEAFFRLWTRKEAYIKALGDGLRHPLNAFSMSCKPQARMLEPALPGWSMHHFDPAAGYVGALAVHHPSPAIRMRRLVLNGGRLAEATDE